jgi:hypothetical protein
MKIRVQIGEGKEMDNRREKEKGRKRKKGWRRKRKILRKGRRGINNKGEDRKEK